MIDRARAIAAAAARSRRRALIAAGALAGVTAVLAAVAAGRPAPTPRVADPADAGPRPDAGAAHGPFDAGAARPCDGYQSCAARCGEAPAEPDACVRAADQLRAGSGVARDVAGARARYRATCRATADAAACTRLALTTGLLDDRAAAPDWIEPRDAPAGLLAAACQEGGDRGLLACAALHLLAVPLPDPAPLHARLAMCPLADATACAAEVARDACLRERLPEACYLATLAPSTDAWADDELGRACRTDRDPIVCHYGWLATRTRNHQLVACSDIESEPSVAPACLGRAREGKSYVLRACGLGTCDGVSEVRTLEPICHAGQLSACAALVARPRTAPSIREAALARAAALAPEVELAEPGLADAALRPAYQACRYGSAPACDTVVSTLPASSPLRAELAAYAARLRAPFTP